MKILRSQKKKDIPDFKTFENFEKEEKKRILKVSNVFEISRKKQDRVSKLSGQIQFQLILSNVPEINKHRRRRCSSRICSLSSGVPGSVALSRHRLWSDAWAPPPWFYFLGIRKDRRGAWSPSGKPSNLSNPSSSPARFDASSVTAISSRSKICNFAKTLENLTLLPSPSPSIERSFRSSSFVDHYAFVPLTQLFVPPPYNWTTQRPYQSVSLDRANLLRSPRRRRR